MIWFDECFRFDIVPGGMNILELLESDKMEIIQQVLKNKKEIRNLEAENLKLIQEHGLESILGESVEKKATRAIQRNFIHFGTLRRFLKKVPLTNIDLWMAIHSESKLAESISEEMFEKSIQHYLSNGKIAEVKGKLALKK